MHTLVAVVLSYEQYEQTVSLNYAIILIMVLCYLTGFFKFLQDHASTCMLMHMTTVLATLY